MLGVKYLGKEYGLSKKFINLNTIFSKKIIIAIKIL